MGVDYAHCKLNSFFPSLDAVLNQIIQKNMCLRSGPNEESIVCGKAVSMFKNE